MDALQVSKEEFREVSTLFPVVWPKYYLGLVNGDVNSHPIARMGRPVLSECKSSPDDLQDPVGDHRQRIGPFLVQKHNDRIIILVTKKCHFYCRFCFRRDEGLKGIQEPCSNDWDSILEVIRTRNLIEEVILSGGDPLTLSDSGLNWIINRIGEISSVKKIRIHTRAPVHFPERITDDLMKSLSARVPVVFVTHFNHFSELTCESERAIKKIQEHGIMVKNQSVLLAGVNDCPWVLGLLNHRLIQWGVQPYYLHHPDRVQGNQIFRVSIARGRVIYNAFSTLDSEFKPKYVIDLPDGKGKVPVSDMEHKTTNVYRFIHPSGEISIYRDLQCKVLTDWFAV